jgi:molecular chaperone GrpE
MKPETEKPEASKAAQKEEKKEISETDKLKSELQKKEEKIQELTETAKRVQAEFENYKKMSEKRNSDFISCASKGVIRKILPVLDSLELAAKNLGEKEKLAKGVELVYAQLYSALEEEGLERINALNQKFDPYKEEALLIEETSQESEDDIVSEELQKGYTINGFVIRTSKVKVKKFKKEQEMGK